MANEVVLEIVKENVELDIRSSVAGGGHGIGGVSEVAYDETNHKIVRVKSGVSGDVVSASTIVEDGGAVLASERGVANGVATLDDGGRVPSSQLPSYVDDVIESYPRAGQTELSANWLATESASGPVIVPEGGKIYVLMADTAHYAAESQFRWGGSVYSKLNDGGVSAITNAEIDTICN